MEITLKELFFCHGITASKKSLHNLFRLSGPILESKGMHVIFQEKDKKKGKKMLKRAKYSKIWAKMNKI